MPYRAQGFDFLLKTLPASATTVEQQIVSEQVAAGAQPPLARLPKPQSWQARAARPPGSGRVSNSEFYSRRALASTAEVLAQPLFNEWSS
jgi:hypothetical protein